MLKHTAQLFHSTITSSDRVLIAFPTAIDIDSVVSGLTLAMILQKSNKSVAIASNDTIPTNLLENILLGKNLENQLKEFSKFILPISATFEAHDLIITINTTELTTLGGIFNANQHLFYSAPIINIGHGERSEPFGALNLIQPTAASASEIIYELLNELDAGLLNEEIATCLLAGMIYKTKKFKSPEISSRTISAFRLLMDSGAQKNQLFENMYRTKTPSILKLWSAILLKLQTDSKKQIAWVTVQQKDFEQSGAGPAELFNLTSELLNSIASLRAVVFYYKENNEPTALVIANQNPEILKKITAPATFRSRDFLKISRPNIQQLLQDLQLSS
jgi:phosphoesterase RecJ-like protein